jgi:hypothetical protein
MVKGAWFANANIAPPASRTSARRPDARLGLRAALSSSHSETNGLAPSLCRPTFFDAATEILVEAFNGLAVDLELRTLADRERAATIVIELARARATLDAAKLRDDAVLLMRKDGLGEHDLGLTPKRPSRRSGRRCHTVTRRRPRTLKASSGSGSTAGL